MAALDRASAQQAETELPGITVEGGGAKKKSAAKKAAAPAPAPAPAEPAASVDSEAARLDAPYDTPAGVSAVGRSELETFGQVDVGDVLRTIPGTYTRESASNPGIAVNIRGFEGAGRVNMTIDGVRQNFRFTTHEAQGFVYVDPALLAGIDVQRGAVSTAGGAGALAGTANMRTLDVEDILEPGHDHGTLSSVTWGSNGVGWAEMASGAVRTESVAFAGAISKRDQHNYENGDGIEVDNSNQDLISGLMKAHIKIAPDQQLSLGTVLYNNDFVANSYDQTIRSKIFTGNYVYDPADELIEFRANLYGSNLEMNYLAGINPFATNAGRIIEDKGWGFDASNTSRFRLGAVAVKAEYGYEYFYDDVLVVNSTNVPDRGVNPSGESSISGLFSQTTFSLGVFDLIGGLRYDEFMLQGTGSVTANNPLGMPAGPYAIDRTDGRLNPKVTLAAKPLPWLQPYVTYSESMRAPTISESLTGGNHPATGGPTQSFYPNPFLDTEIQKGWEFGANLKQHAVFSRGDSLNFKADYFTMDVTNYITACFGPMGQIFFCNAPGQSKVSGVELQGMYDAGIVFSGVSYTYTHSELPSQVNGFGATSYLPDHVFTVTAGVRLMNEKLTLGARGYVTSQSYIGEINVAPGDSPYLDGYELVDLFSAYELDHGVTLALTVTNLFDVTYSPALTTPNSQSDPFAPSVETGRGRTFLLTSRAQF